MATKTPFETHSAKLELLRLQNTDQEWEYQSYLAAKRQARCKLRIASELAADTADCKVAMRLAEAQAVAALSAVDQALLSPKAAKAASAAVTAPEAVTEGSTGSEAAQS